MHAGIGLCLFVAVIFLIPDDGTSAVLPRFIGNNVTSTEGTSANDQGSTTAAATTAQSVTSGSSKVTSTSQASSQTSEAVTSPSSAKPTVLATLKTKPTKKTTIKTTEATTVTTKTAAPTVVTTAEGQVGIVGGDETFFMPPVVPSSNHLGPAQLQSSGVCGKSTLTGPHEKVINGTDTEINQFPWMVAILGRHLQHVECGGTVIDRRHILTAAHCVIKYKHRPQNIIIHIGEYNISVQNETELVKPTAEEVIIHPDHDRAYFLYDAAIIRLTEPLDFAENIRPVCLPFDINDSYTGHNSTVIGWGTTELGRNPSDVLLQAQLDIISNKKCHDAYLERYPERITEEVVCAAQDGKDSCQGDSGGPLMVLSNNTGNQAWYQVGIVSWGIRCADPRYPGVYTRLTSILDWIKVATKL